MARKFLDISEDSRFKSTSPVAIGAWLICYIFINIFVDLGIMYFIWLILSAVFCHLFFQYQPRFIYLTYLFLIKHVDLSPNFDDKQYIYDETKYEDILRVMHEDEIKAKAQKKQRIEKIKVVYAKYLKSLREEDKG